MRLIVRRVRPTPGSQLALFASYSYHGLITDRDGETLELEADHRRHAETLNAIRDLKYGVGNATTRTTASSTPGSGWRSGPVTTMTSRRTPTTSRSTCGATTWTQRWPTAGKASRCTSSGRLSGREHHRADDTRGLAHFVNAKEFHFFPAGVSITGQN